METKFFFQVLAMLITEIVLTIIINKYLDEGFAVLFFIFTMVAIAVYIIAYAISKSEKKDYELMNLEEENNELRSMIKTLLNENDKLKDEFLEKLEKGD